MASHAANSGAPALPSFQRGMSPSNLKIEDKSRGSDYGRAILEPLRKPQQELGMLGAVPLPNGVASASVDDGVSGAASSYTASGVAAARTESDIQLCQLSQNGGTWQWLRTPRV